MFCPWYISLFLFVGVDGMVNSCKKNRFIDYNQMVKTSCLVENCVFALNCSRHTAEHPCPCKRDFVVRYNVTTEHEDDDDDDHDDEDDEGCVTHFGVITQRPGDRRQKILVRRDATRKAKTSRVFRLAVSIRVSTMNEISPRSSGEDQIEKHILLSYP